MIEKFDEEGEDSDEKDGTQVEGNYGEENDGAANYEGDDDHKEDGNSAQCCMLYKLFVRSELT